MIFTLIITLMPIFSAQAWQVDKLQGEVFVKRDGGNLPASLGMELKSGDLIRTGRHAKAKLVEGQTQLWISQRTLFKIEPAAAGGSIGLQLDTGKLRVKVDKQEAEKYRFKVRTTVAGVRGTEFFAEASESGDRLCILEGAVEAIAASGDRIMIPAGQGVLFQEGLTPHLVANSSFLVDRWVAETSFEEKSSGMQSFYVAQEPTRHAIGGSHANPENVILGSQGTSSGNLWFYGLRSFVTVSDAFNEDFNRQTNESDTFTQWWYVSPFVQYGKKELIHIRPSVNFVKSRVSKAFDKRPLFSDDEKLTFSFAEFYYQTNLESFQLTGGAKQITWHDGILISQRNWTSEPMNYSMLRGIIGFDHWQLELLGIAGENPTYALDGFNQVDFVGANFTLPEIWGQAYMLYANLPNKGALPVNYGLFYNREMWNLGYFNQHKYGWLDYQLSVILQKHVRFPIAGVDRGFGQFVDFRLGANFGSQRPWRFGIRQLYASKDFGGIHYDYYLLGTSFWLKEISNINQLRAIVEFQPWENHLLAIEYIHSRQVAANGLFIHRAALADNQFLAGEVDLNYSLKMGHGLTAFASFFWLFPSQLVGTDPLSGFLARLEWDY